jgi:hypothetical protein
MLEIGLKRDFGSAAFYDACQHLLKMIPKLMQLFLGM